MTNGPKTNEKQKSYSKRTSPNKDRTRKPKAALLEKKTDNLYNESVSDKANTAPLPSVDEELLTPDTILKSYASVKSSPIKSNACQAQALQKENVELDPTKGNAVNILELLGKKDNLEKIANSVTKAVEEQSIPIDVPQPSKQACMKTPPCTPTKKSNQCAERFAGLSNSPAPNNLPLPSFSFLDQELSNGAKDEPERLMFPYSTLPAPLLKAASAPSNLVPTSPYLPAQAVPCRDFGSPLTPQPVKPKHPRNRKLHSDQFQAPSESLPIVVQPPVRALNHSPPSNPHLDELSSQLRMMLHIVPTQS